MSQASGRGGRRARPRWRRTAALAALLAAGSVAAEAQAGDPEPLSGAGVKLSGEVGGAQAGFDLASVGDLNGDGVEELVVGAPFGDAGRGSQGGAAYLFYGPVAHDAPLSAADATFLGARPGDFVGEDLGAVGDLDGDGFDELLLSAPGSVPGLQPGSPRPGEAYLFYGERRRKRGTTLLEPACLDDRGDCDAAFFGTHVSDFGGFGIPKHPIGDVDNNGFADLLIGSAGFGGYAGAAHLFYGDGKRLKPMTRLSEADATFVATLPGRFATKPMTGAGDLDGDGVADFAIGAPSTFAVPMAPGEVYVFYGRKKKRWSGPSLMSRADAVLVGTLPGDRTGQGLAGGGDVNGDGRPDLVIGAPGPLGGLLPGAAHVLYGSGTRWQGPLGLGTIAGSTVLHGTAGDSAGASAALGDVDGDGLADVALGAPTSAQGASAYLLFGRSGLGASVPLAASDRRFAAEAPGDRAGASVAIGDVAGGRGADLTVGATRHGGAKGAAYVVRGGRRARSPAP